MSRICLYLDEDSTARGLVESLRSRGVDVVVVGEVNRYGYSDEEQLRWATTHNRVLYSANIRDFYRIHTDFLSREEFHSGIILVQQQRYSIGQLMRVILQLMAVKSAEEMNNRVEFLSNWILE